MKGKLMKVRKKPLAIEYVKTSELVPYAGNAKEHPTDQIEQIKKSILDYGMNDPIAVWHGNEIIEGHGRLIACEELGIEEVPVIRLDDLTDEERREYALVHNKLTMNSGFDEIKLDFELSALPEFDADFFGFDVSALNPNPAQEYDEEADVIPEPPAEPKARRGGVYKLGDHYLMCGDSTSAEDWEKLMQGQKADMVFTDPPYGVAIGDKNKALNAVQKAGQQTENIANDNISEAELYDILKNAFINIRQNCAEDACYFVTSPHGGSLGLMMMMMRDAGLEVRHILIWEKNTATFSLGRLDYDYKHEPIFYTWTKGHHNFRGGEYRTTIWNYDKPRKCDLHPTMKPVELVMNAINDGTKAGMTVLDGFGGSGTTLIACEKTGRKCRMMELDPKYIDVIIERWENMTGKKAVLVNG